MGKSTFSYHVEVEVHVIIYPLRTRDDIKGRSWNPVALDDLTWTLPDWCQSGVWHCIALTVDLIITGRWI